MNLMCRRIKLNIDRFAAELMKMEATCFQMQNCQTSLALSEFRRRACYSGRGVIYGIYSVYFLSIRTEKKMLILIAIWMGWGGGSKGNVLLCLPNQCACMLES